MYINFKVYMCTLTSNWTCVRLHMFFKLHVYTKLHSNIPKLHSDISPLLSAPRSNRLLLAVVVMLRTRVVDARIVVALVVDRIESFTGATMVKFWLFAHLVLQLLFILQFVSKFYYVQEYFPKNLIVQSRRSKCSDFLQHWSLPFCFILFMPQMFLICKKKFFWLVP